jgi:hypothetical protein
MIRRIIFSLLIGIGISAVFTEVAYYLFRETTRPPKTIELTIPVGTADSVAHGEQPPSLPENMDFVVGDVLLVKNQDVVDHQLGPLWIPAGTSAQLKIAQEGQVAYECSFQTTKYLGLDVHEALTPSTRLSGIFFAGLPLGVLIALYSVVMPARKKEPA